METKEEPTIKILPTDRVFTDSPDDGWSECICSRCGKQINETSIRAWTEDGKLEWRYHPACLGFQTSEVNECRACNPDCDGDCTICESETGDYFYDIDIDSQL